jgi:hypothetical protein
MAGLKLACLVLLLSTTAERARADVPTPKRTPLVTLEWISAPSLIQHTAFVLYDDGLVLYDIEKGRRRSPGSGYAAITLDATAKRALLDSLPIDARFMALAHEYDAAPNVIDGTLHQVCVHTQRSSKCVGVHHIDLSRPKAGSIAPTSVPRVLVELIARLSNYADPRAEAWLPERVPLRFYVEKRAGSAKPWPTKWLGPMVEQTDGWAGPYLAWSVSGSELRSLRDFLDDKKLVLIDGKRGYVSYEIVLPEQDVWQMK